MRDNIGDNRKKRHVAQVMLEIRNFIIRTSMILFPQGPPNVMFYRSLNQLLLSKKTSKICMPTMVSPKQEKEKLNDEGRNSSGQSDTGSSQGRRTHQERSVFTL